MNPEDVELARQVREVTQLLVRDLRDSFLEVLRAKQLRDEEVALALLRLAKAILG